LILELYGGGPTLSVAGSPFEDKTYMALKDFEVATSCWDPSAVGYVDELKRAISNA